MKSEEKLFKFIRKKVPNSVSFVDEIAQVLGVNYDAAYRRITGKTALDLTAVLKLMEAYNFSMDEIFTDKKAFTMKKISPSFRWVFVILAKEFLAINRHVKNALRCGTNDYLIKCQM